MNIDRFCRGAMCGGLIGDCYGYVYEDRPRVAYTAPLELLAETQAADDTQMALATLRSLRQHGQLVPSHLAQLFAEDYFTDGGHRYYGGSIARVFLKMKSNKYVNPFQYAAEQFDGSGSYGNGGAMRASPTAVYGLKLPDEEFEKLILDVTRLTHTHPLAFCGALLQAFAVRLLWINVCSKNGGELVPDQFIDQLFARVRQVQYHRTLKIKEAQWTKALQEYEMRLNSVKMLLARKEEPEVDEVVKILGNNLEALNSVPTALFVFLRSLKPVPGIALKSIPLTCLVYVIGLSGDTDTIGTMACSLAGAYVGLSPDDQGPDSPIPLSILTRCEGWSKVDEMITWLQSHLVSA